jgi:hypothetical protein
LHVPVFSQVKLTHGDSVKESILLLIISIYT